MNNRQQFIKNFFSEIASIDYTLLKFIEGKIEDIDVHSDLDLLIEPATIPFIQSIIKNDDNIESFDDLELSSMHQFFIFFVDGSFLQIDCLFKLIRKNTVYLSNKYIQENTIVKDGVKCCNDKILFEHVMLFHQLNNDGVPRKYCEYFGAQPDCASVLSAFNQKYHTGFSLASAAAFDPVFKDQLKSYLRLLAENNFSNNLSNTVNYVKETITKCWKGRGKIITFSGVDGAGKSTILEETKLMLERKFRKKVVVLRHRPSMLPILSSIQYGKKGAEKRAAEKLPRQGSNKSKLSSTLRFFYYYLDYIFGQWYIYSKYILFDYIVLYDRYYFDFIVDGKRSNIQMDSKITKLLYRFVHKPKLNFFLYAPAQIILARKKELSAADIESLTSNYQDLFSNFSDKYEQKYLPIKNIDKATTLDFIQKEIQEIL